MRYHEKQMLKNPAKAILIKDRRGQLNRFTGNTTVYISHEEYKKIRPGEPPRRVDFVFRSGSQLMVDPDIANFLIAKYEFLFSVSQNTGNVEEVEDDLLILGYHSLVQLLKRLNDAAAEKGIERKPGIGKLGELRGYIRHFRRLGVKPKPIEEDEDEV